ncbi:MAG TPA: DUF6476 family protein [Devosiaceae bacterium]|jgi:hypothetical protein|nr:DUF6476 family protein [Devosiaceae bacterium]
MSTPDPQKDEPQKLTPEAIAVIGRARRSFIFSIGLLIVGFIVIAGALVYRASKDSGNPAAAAGTTYTAAAVKIPAGSTIVSAVAADGEISVTYKNGSATNLRIFDGKTGAILREVPVVGE